MNGQWHLPDELIERYEQGELPPVQVMSVEAHLVGCGRCRGVVSYSEEWLVSSWEGIEDLVDRPRPRLVARALQAVGVPGYIATFLAATPALARGWLVAVTAVLAFAVTAAKLAARDPAQTLDALVPFLAVAPVLPLAGIALAYGQRVDPLYETQAATPMAGPRALLLRALAVLATAMILTGLATPLLPGPPGIAAAWLLPALALTLATLALSTRFSPLPSAATLAAAWLGAVLVANGHELELFTPTAQAVYGLTALLLLPLIYVRFHHGEPAWKRP